MVGPGYSVSDRVGPIAVYMPHCGIDHIGLFQPVSVWFQPNSKSVVELMTLSNPGFLYILMPNN